MGKLNSRCRDSQYLREFRNDEKLQAEFSRQGDLYLSFRNEEAGKAARAATIKGRGTTTFQPLRPAEIEALKTEFAASCELKKEFATSGLEGFIAFKNAERQGLAMCPVLQKLM